MTQPRSILAGATYLITRRTLRRHMLLCPDAEMTNLITYALAISAARYEIDVHVLGAMSTHLHIVATDTQGVLPRFLQHFHRLVALGTKALRNWEGPVWDHEPTSVVRLVTPQAVIEKIAYTMANPVAAGLVRHASEWAGAKVLVAQLGRGVLRATRPLVYFSRKNADWPAEAELPLTLPPCFDDGAAGRVRRAVATELDRLERAAHAALGSRPILGASAAAKVAPDGRAESVELTGQRNPTFAVGRGNGALGLQVALAVRAFRSAYRSALDHWRKGVRSVQFPVGTWWMRVLHAVAVDDIGARAAAA